MNSLSSTEPGFPAPPSNKAEAQFGSAPILVNAVTDPGAMFEVGNSPIGFEKSWEAGSISLVISGLCFLVRGASEIKARRKELGLPEPETPNDNWMKRNLSSAFNKLVENRGAALTVSGSALLVSAGFIFSKGFDHHNLAAFYHTAKPALIYTSFGIANTTRGIGHAFKGRPAQKILDMIATGSATVGLIMSGQDIDTQALAAYDAHQLLNVAVKTSFVAATAISARQAACNEQPSGLAQPNRIMAGGLVGNAILSSPRLRIANMIFAGAYGSIDALQKHGGVYQAMSSMKSRVGAFCDNLFPGRG